MAKYNMVVNIGGNVWAESLCVNIDCCFLFLIDPSTQTHLVYNHKRKVVRMFLSNMHLTFDLSLLSGFSVLIDRASRHSIFFKAIKERSSIMRNPTGIF